MQVVSVQIGQARPHPGGSPGKLSGIYKEPVELIEAGVLGAAGDNVLDTRHHGGPSKALCCYCLERYEHWRAVYPDLDWGPGSFGENLTVSGLDEDTARVGDVYDLGAARVQISQPRGPCATLAARHRLPEFAKVCVASLHTGWYFRVLRAGVIRAGDAVVPVARHPLGVTVAAANATRYAHPPEPAGIAALLEVDALSDAWRQDLDELLKRAEVARFD